MTIKYLPFCLGVLLLSGAPTQGTLYTSGTLDALIPDGNPNGISSTINVSGLTSDTRDVNVRINVSGGFTGDLYGYLTFGNGTVILLNRIGKTSSDPFGSSTAGFDITLDDSAATDIHGISGISGSPITGTYQPDGRTADPQLVNNTSPRNSSLAAFNGSDPNGSWTLFLADMAGGGGNSSSTLVSWGLEIEVVPEPVTMALAILAGMGLLFAAWGSFTRAGKNKIKVRTVGILY